MHLFACADLHCQRLRQGSPLADLTGAPSAELRPRFLIGP